MRLASWALASALAALPARAQDRGGDWNAQRKIAIEEYKRGQFGSSSRAIVQFLERAPHMVPRGRAYLLLAQAQGKLDKWAEALVSLRKAEAAAENGSFLQWSIRVRIAEAMLRLGESDKAQGVLQEVARCPYPILTSEAKLEQGIALLRAGREADAQQILKDLLQGHPEYRSDPQVGKALGYLLMKTGSAPQANEFIGRSIDEADWGDPNHLFLQGVAYRTLGKGQEARRFFQLVYKYAPDDNWKAEALYQIGEDFLQRGMMSLATQSFEDILTSHPRSAARRKTLHRLAIIDLTEGRYKEAAARAEKILALAPQGALEEDIPGAQAQFLMGEAALRAKDYQGAKAAFERLLQSPPMTMEARSRLIWLSLKRQDYNQAVKMADEFLAQFSWGDAAGNVLLLRGLAYQKGGNGERAVADYVRFIDGYPNHPLQEQAAFLLASAYFDSKNWAEIVSHVSGILQRLPPRPSEWQGGALFCLAEAYFELGKYPEALAIYRDLARRFPPGRLTPRVYQGMAFCNGMMEKYEEAFLAEEKALAFSESQKNKAAIRDGLLVLGDILFNKRRYKSALAYYDAFLHNFPHDELTPKALFRGAFALTRLGRSREALSRWEQLARRYPSSAFAPQALLEKGRYEFKTAAYAAAEETLTRLLKDFPEAPEAKDALLLIGQTLFNEGRHEDAAVRYEEFLAKYKDDEQAQDVRRLVETSLYQQALNKDQPNLFLSKFPDSALAEDLFWDLGLKYWNKKDYVKSLENFQQLLRHFPDREKTKRASYMIGEIYFRQENFKEAGAAYLNYVESAPSDADLIARASFRGAVCLFQQGAAEDAAHAFDRFLKDHPDHALSRDARYNMILAYMKGQRFPEAIEAAKEFLGKHPKDPDVPAVQLQIGNAYKSAGDGKRAASAYRKVSKASAQAIEAYYNLGQLYQAQEDYEKAKAAYAALVPLKPADAELRLSGIAILAEFYERLGNPKRSISLYREVARLSKNPEWAQTARRKAAALAAKLGGE